MSVGPIVPEDDGWWCQVVGRSGHTWTIRVRGVSESGIELYECWVNEVLLPGFWRREPLTEETLPTRILSVALRYIESLDSAS